MTVFVRCKTGEGVELEGLVESTDLCAFLQRLHDAKQPAWEVQMVRFPEPKDSARLNLESGA